MQAIVSAQPFQFTKTTEIILLSAAEFGFPARTDQLIDQHGTEQNWRHEEERVDHFSYKQDHIVRHGKDKHTPEGENDDANKGGKTLKIEWAISEDRKYDS